MSRRLNSNINFEQIRNYDSFQTISTASSFGAISISTNYEPL